IMSLPAGSSAFSKPVIDGVGRTTVSYFGYYPSGSSSSSSSSSSEGSSRGGGITYAHAVDISGAIIVEQAETAYDPASNVIQTTFRQRFHNATGTGPLTYPGGAEPQARVTYVAKYPDALGRPLAEANYGTNGNVTLVRSATIPARSDTICNSLVPRP
ncbi:MAG TPA: hypothetical protein VGY66_30620, partial [Gemmataceae bacterium]|nr:hypothetical protein [Gemmataceae bacterium]